MNNDNIQPNPPVTQSPEPIQTVPNTSQFSTDDLIKKISNSGLLTKRTLVLIGGVSLGIIVIIVILGLLFGKRGIMSGISSAPTPTPFVLITPPPAIPNSLSTSPDKLNQLKDQIEELDVKQDRLQPPPLNFNVGF